MARNLLQDIKKIEKVKKYEIPTRVHNDSPSFSNSSSLNFDKQEKTSGSRYTLWTVAFVSVIFLFFALSFLFSSATVTVNPKINAISLNENLSATKDSISSALSFNLTVVSDQESKTVLLEEKDFNQAAKGKVLIYNKFSSLPQSFLVDTRLEGSNGKIYKTKTKIVVPGMSKDGTPGKAGVDIYASDPGVEYNSAPIDFKVLGFKGTPKYTKFYGRSVGEITGGVVGKSRQLSDDQKSTIEKEIKTNLENKLISKASQIPEGLVLFKDAVSFVFDDSSVSQVKDDGSVTLNIKGTLYGFILDEKKLTKKIIEYLVPDYNGSEAYISNIKDLTFVLLNKESVIFQDVKDIDFNIYGVPKIVYKIDSEKLALDLSNKDKKDFNQILSQYTNIESASSSIKPIWKSTFPEKTENIKVIINYPK